MKLHLKRLAVGLLAFALVALVVGVLTHFGVWWLEWTMDNINDPLLAFLAFLGPVLVPCALPAAWGIGYILVTAEGGNK